MYKTCMKKHLLINIAVFKLSIIKRLWFLAVDFAQLRKKHKLLFACDDLFVLFIG
jgi:hypothetical protein